MASQVVTYVDAKVEDQIIDGETMKAPSQNAVYDALSLKAPIDSPTFTGIARAVTPSGLSDNKTITTKEYVDAGVAQVKADVVSQTILLNNTTTAPSEDAVRKELDLKSPLNGPVFTGVAKVPDITTNSIMDPLAITNKGYVDSQITAAGNIYTKDGTLTDNRKVTLDGKNLDFIGNIATNPTRLAPDGTMTVGGNININNKVAGTNTPISGLRFTNDENGVDYSAASITAQTGDDKGKGQLSFKVKTVVGVDTEAARITDKGNVLVGGTTDDNTAVLNVQSTTKGVLMPRQTKAQRDLITTPTTGLQVYQTNASGSSQEGQYLKTSTGWNRMLLEGDVKLDYYTAINTSGQTISGSTAIPVAVNITGVDSSNNINITISDAGTSTTARFDGVVIDNVLSGASCKVYVRYVSVNSNTSAFAQNASLFLSTGGSFTDDPSGLPFGVNMGKVISVSPANGAVLFTVYPDTDFFRNQYERINGSTDETVFTGRIVSSLEPLDDTYLTNKKYVDEAIAFSQLYQGGWNAATNNPVLAAAPIAKNGWTYDVIVESGGTVNYPNMCSPANILKGYSIKFNGTCWVVLEKQFPSATTTQEGMVKLDSGITASTTLVPTSNLLKQVSDANLSHIANISNPHSVTKAQVGLGNADDTNDANKPVSGPQQTALDLKADKVNGAVQITDNNPYGNIGTLAGVTQAAINAGINTKLGEKTQLNGTGLVRMAGTTVSYDNTAYAPLASPVFIGDAQAVTPALGDNDTSIATTSFVNAVSSGLWSKTGNAVNDNSDFIGTTNNSDLVFKTFNIERMRVNYSLAQVNIGTTISPTKFKINTSSELFKNEALTIVTNDANPLNMTFQAFGSGTGTPYFDISSYTYNPGTFVNTPANISMLSEGGILSIGKDDFAGLSEKLEVNGNVRATGFKIPSGTSNQFLMADGSVSTGVSTSGWSLSGNAGTIPGTNFIGTTDNKDIVFKANNKERWRMGSNSGTFYVGDLIDSNSAGKLSIISDATINSIPLSIRTAGFSNQLTLLFQANLSGSSKYFDIQTYIGDSSNPANLSLMPDGGILNLGYFDFTGLSEKLEVNGKVRATGFKIPNGTGSQYLMADGSVSSSSSNGWGLSGNAGTTPVTNFIGTTDSQDIVFKTNNKEHWRMGSDTGTLYVGDIIDPQSSGSLMIVTNSVGDDSTPFIIRTADAASPLVMTIQAIKGLDPYFKISTKSEGNPAANLSLLPGGGILNIGYDSFLGLTEKVEVNGAIKADRFMRNNGSPIEMLMADGSTSLLKTPWELKGNTGINPTTDFIGTTDNNPLIFKTNNTQSLYVAPTGNVMMGSFGVSDTDIGLEIRKRSKENSAQLLALSSEDVAGSRTQLMFRRIGREINPRFEIDSYDEVNSVRTQLPISLMPNGGTVAIGLNAGNAIDSSYRLYVNGPVGGSQGWAVASDKRLKTNIHPFENGLSKVMQMKPVMYDKKSVLESKDYNIHEMGFIAQDLKLLFPKGVVNEGADKDKLLSVNYTELIPVLTNAIQEQQKIIEMEKAKNDKQQKEIDELKAMVKQLLDKKL